MNMIPSGFGKTLRLRSAIAAVALVAVGIVIAQENGVAPAAPTPAAAADPVPPAAVGAPATTPVPATTTATPPIVPIAALLTPNAERGMLLAVTRAGGQIVAVGGNGVIVRSAEGEHWQQVASPVDTALNAVAFADDKRGWAVGHDGVILGTTDGGASWTIQNFEPDRYAPLFAVLPISVESAIAVGAFGAIKATADGGRHWADIDALALSQDKLHLNAITRFGSGRLAVAGEHGLVGISDDGLHWTRANTPYEGSFFGIAPWGERGVIAFGMRGNVYAIDDVASGAWRKLAAGTGASFFGGETLADGRILLTGAEGNVVVIDKGGTASPLAGAVVGATQGSLTGSVATPTGLVLVGESGVKRLPKI